MTKVKSVLRHIHRATSAFLGHKSEVRANFTTVKFGNEEVFFQFRADSDGDKGVIEQIFHNNDYDISHWEQGAKLFAYHNDISRVRPSLIVDAGANIGASAVFFAKTFDDSFVFSIEPDRDNWRLLEANTAGLSVYNFNGAIANKDGELILEDPGRSDWGFMTKRMDGSESTADKVVKSICPKSILSHAASANKAPLILKIDIEGGESELFDGDTDWLDEFPLVIIELHDWMLPFSGSSSGFIKAVAKYDFDFLIKGENVFLFNRRILN
jgi:FkbM family methyltransferase